MRISDWSSDVCSSDLRIDDVDGGADLRVGLGAELLHLGAHVVEVLRHFDRLVDGVEAVRCDLWAVGHVLDGGGEVADRVAEGIVVAERAEHRLHAIEVVGTYLGAAQDRRLLRSEEHTSELQSLMRISYAVLCLKTKKTY